MEGAEEGLTLFKETLSGPYSRPHPWSMCVFVCLCEYVCILDHSLGVCACSGAREWISRQGVV